MNRQQYMRSLIDQGLKPSEIAAKLREFDNETSGGQGVEFENPSNKPDLDQEHASEFTNDDFNHFTNKLKLANNKEYQDLLEVKKNTPPMAVGKIQEIDNKLKAIEDGLSNAKVNTHNDNKKIELDAEEKAKNRSELARNFYGNKEKSGKYYLEGEALEAKVKEEYQRSLDQNLDLNRVKNDKTYQTQKLALDNLTTAKKQNTSGFATGFVAEDEQISISDDTKNVLLNTLNNKQLERLAYNDKLVPLNGSKDSKEAILSEAKSQVLKSRIETLQREINDVDVSNLSSSEKDKLKNDFEEKRTALAAELKFNIADGLFANNFEMTKDFEDWTQRNLESDSTTKQFGDIIGTFGQEMGKVAIDYSLGTSLWLSNIMDNHVSGARGIYGGRTESSEDSDFYTGTDYLNDLYKKYVSNNNILGVAEGDYTLDFGDGFGGKNAAKTAAQMLPFTIGVIASMRKGNFKDAAKLFNNPMQFAAMGRNFKLTQGTLNGMKAAFKMTAIDNYFEGQEMGLTDREAGLYSTIKSTGTGLSQAIMPDANLFFGNAGKATLGALAQNLKSAATRQGIKTAAMNFFARPVAEFGEEMMDVGFGDLAKISVGRNMDLDIMNMQVVEETAAATLLLSGMMAPFGVSGDFKQTKEKVYNLYRKDGARVIDALQAQKEAAQKKFDRARSKDRKKKWQKVVGDIDKGLSYGQDILAAINVSPETVTAQQLDLLVTKQDLLRQKAGKDSSTTVGIDNQIAEIDKKIKESDVAKGREAIYENLSKNVEKLSAELNIETKREKNTAAVKKRINEINKEIKDPKKKLKVKQSKDAGFIVQYPDGKQEIIINEDVATSTKNITVAQHELLHGALLSTIKTNPGATQKLAAGLASELVKIDPRLLGENSYISKRLELYKSDPKSVRAEEMLTAFSDAIGKGFIKYEATQDQSFLGLGGLTRNILSQLGFKSKFKTGKDVFNFIKDFNKSVEKGKFSKGLIKTITEGADISGELGDIEVTDDAGNTITKSSKAIQDEINDMGKPGVFDSEKVISDLYSRGLLDGLIKSKIPFEKPPGFSQEDFVASTIAELVPHIRRFDPNVNDSLSGWINSQLMNKIGNVFKKGTAATKAAFEQDVTETAGAKQVADTSTEPEVVSPTRSKFRRQLGINEDLVTKIKNAVIKTFGTKLPEVNNKSFVKELTKRYRVELKTPIAKLMGTREEYKKFLTKNKNNILNNIPISTLVRFERNTKPEDRVFTKEIKRNLSPTEVDEAVAKGTLPKDVNRLSGPTLYEKITPTDKQFLDFYLGEDVAPSKRGTRKDALANEIGVELAFDATMEVVQSPDVVAKREQINELLGIQSQENDIAIISKQINRDPNVKFSKGSNGDILTQALDGIGIDSKIEQAAVLENFINGTLGIEADVAKNVIENALIKTIPAAVKAGTAFRKTVETNLPFLKKVKSLQTFWKSSQEITQEGQDVIEDHVEKYLFDMIDKGLLPKELLSLQTSKNGTTEGSFITKFFKFDTRALGTSFKEEFINRLKNAPSYKDLKDPALKKYYTNFFNSGTIVNGIFKDSFEPANSKKLGPNEIGFINKIAEQNLTRKQKIKRINEFMKINTEGASVMNSLQNFDLAINSSIQRWVDGMPNKDQAIEYVYRDKQANTNEVMSDRALAPFTSVYLIDGPQKLAIKGEHVVDSGTVSALTVQSLYNGTFEQDFHTTRKGFEQSLGPKEDFDNLDKILGKNSPLGDMRFMYDIPLAKATYDFTTGKSKYDMMMENLAGKQLEDLKQRAVQQEQASLENRVLSSKASITEQLSEFDLLDQAAEVARDPNKVRKGISVFDFDDTLARTKSKVRAKMKDGSTIELDATEFAARAEQISDQVAEFDFSDFNKVIGGTKGPLFELAQKRQGKFGNKDIFILTARPQASAPAIQTFLKGLGLDVKIENITGLEDGTPQAKANWVLQKAVDGYNDFYFADDAYKNVKAVQDVLNVIDVKSDIQQAIVKSSKTLDQDFNNIIEQTSGVLSFKEYSDAAARSQGENKGRYQFFLPPSAEDFEGLIYSFVGKGKKGEAQMKWFNDNLFKPFARGIADINNARQSLANDFNALRKQYKDVNKLLGKKTNYLNFTYDQAVRVYLYDKAGFDIPGISKTDLRELKKIVNSDPTVKEFADKTSKITKLKNGYVSPDQNWIVGNLVSDMNDIVQRVGRKKYLKDWIRNKDIIFSKKNLNKIEAIHGTRFREALEDILYRMENGTNRNFGQNRLVNGFMNWINNSIGAIMFFNSRSALLQTISSINYINWGDNNPLKAGMAFANQKQYWSDFTMLFNSDYLKQRRSGLQSDIQEAEIANAVANSKNKANAAIAYLLKKGFIPTQMADSFAIASGGASFYRNRLNKYLKEGMDKKAAEEKAFQDFRETTERNQQSARPDRISMQQASPLGRLILAFQNTPMQYTREIKKEIRNLINGRGDWKTSVSKIAYYGAVQNFMFTAMQNALFGLMFGGDEEEDLDWEAKKLRTANSMADTILRGSGVAGAVVSTLKNTIMKFLQQENARSADHAYTLIEMANLSPPIGSKLRKIYSATQTYKLNKREIANNGWGLDNPSYLALGNVVSATTNIPLDRAVNKMNNLKEAMDTEHAAWQRIAMALGWSTWDVGVNPYEAPVDPRRKKLVTRKNKNKSNIRRKELKKR